MISPSGYRTFSTDASHNLGTPRAVSKKLVERMMTRSGAKSKKNLPNSGSLKLRLIRAGGLWLAYLKPFPPITGLFRTGFQLNHQDLLYISLSIVTGRFCCSSKAQLNSVSLPTFLRLCWFTSDESLRHSSAVQEHLAGDRS
jgi:hypothetical protein